MQINLCTWTQGLAGASFLAAPWVVPVLVVSYLLTPVAAEAAILDRTVNFYIPAQPRESALIEFSKQAHVQMVISNSLAGSVEVPAINETAIARLVLQELIAQSGLKYTEVGDSVSISRMVELSAPKGNGQPHNSVAYNQRTNEELKNRESDSDYEVGVNEINAGRSAPVAEKSDAEKGLQTVVITGRYEFLSADTSGATNLPVPIEKVPQSISLVSNDFIEAADLKTLGEIAEYTPGAINVGNQGNNGSSIKLRGFNPGQAVDGVNVNNGLFEPDYAIFDRLEMVKGPSSVVYGISSPGGLVNSVTKSATPESPSYVSIQAGSWSSYRIEGQLATALDAAERVRAIGVAVQDQGDSFMHTLYHRKTTLYGGLNLSISDSVTAYMHGGYERFVRPSFDGTPTEADGTPAPLPRSFCICSDKIVITTSLYHAEGDLTWHAADGLDFSLKGNYQKVHFHGAQDYSFDLSSDGNIGIAAAALPGSDTENYGIGLSSIYKFDDIGLKNSFVSLAALYQHSSVGGTEVFPDSTGTVNISDGESAIAHAFESLLATATLPSAFPFSTQTTARVITISGQAVLQAIDPLSILLGASYSKPDETSVTNGVGQEFSISGQMSYRAGLTYEFLHGANAYISYSESFNPQLLLDASNSVLPPQKGEQYEIGMKYRSNGGRFLVTGDAFQIREKNVGQIAGQTELGIDFYRAIGEVTHRGVEIQALGKLMKQWQINAGYSYLDPKISNAVASDAATVGQTELFLPRQTASIYATYLLQSGLLRGLSFGGGARYVSDQRTSYSSSQANEVSQLPSTKNLPGYVLLDTTISYNTKNWLVQLNAHNILDRHYFINNYQTLFYGNFPGEPANVALSVRRQF